MDTAGIKAQERILSEKQGATGAHADIEFDSVVSVAILIEVAVARSRPSGAISHRGLRLAGPSRIVKIGGNPVRGRRYRQQIGDHGFVESGEPVVDEPRPLRRPVPEQRVVFCRATVPIPFDGFPKAGDSPVKTLLVVARPLEVLAAGE